MPEPLIELATSTETRPSLSTVINGGGAEAAVLAPLPASILAR